MGNYRPFLQGPLPVANYTRIIIPGRFWTRPPSTKSTRMASSATPLHDSLIELAIPDAHAHAIKWYLKWCVSQYNNNNNNNNIQLLHTPSLNSVIYYYPRCGYIPRGRRPSGIFTPRVVINTLFNEKECAIVVLL